MGFDKNPLDEIEGSAKCISSGGIAHSFCVSYYAVKTSQIVTSEPLPVDSRFTGTVTH